MTLATPLFALRTYFTDKCGSPLAGGKVFTYEKNSLTPKETFADGGLSVSNTNPVILDEFGKADIFLDKEYRIQVYSRDGVLIDDKDNVSNSIELREIVFNTTNPSLNINNGTIQILTLIEDGTLIASLQSGQSMTLLIDLNGFNLNIPFKKTQDFTLTNGGKNLCVLFKIGDDVYITSGGAFL